MEVQMLQNVLNLQFGKKTFVLYKLFISILRTKVTELKYQFNPTIRCCVLLVANLHPSEYVLAVPFSSLCDLSSISSSIAYKNSLVQFLCLINQLFYLRIFGNLNLFILVLTYPNIHCQTEKSENRLTFCHIQAFYTYRCCNSPLCGRVASEQPTRYPRVSHTWLIGLRGQGLTLLSCSAKA